ncbi:MAG: hypothetical protein ACI9G1_006077 [Pirellulaceae bacterium]|jgi:hypothetical protein
MHERNSSSRCRLLDASPNDASPNDASPNDASPNDASPNDASPNDASPNDAVVTKCRACSTGVLNRLEGCESPSAQFQRATQRATQLPQQSILGKRYSHLVPLRDKPSTTANDTYRGSSHLN